MIRLDKVCKRFQANLVVRDLDLDVAHGELLILLGQSGCGKTTTLKMINRLIEPTSGAILIDGNDAQSLNADQLRRSIGYVVQGVGLFPHQTIAQNIATVPRLLGWDSARIAKRIDELLAMVHLEPATFRDRLPRQLSGGQQQRIGFARALAAEPKLMLLDEPFGALDPLTRDALQIEFRSIQQSLSLTAVMVTHDMTEALLLADRIAVMRDGRIVQIDTPANLLNKPADDHVRELLGTPARQSDRIHELMNS